MQAVAEVKDSWSGSSIMHAGRALPWCTSLTSSFKVWSSLKAGHTLQVLREPSPHSQLTVRVLLVVCGDSYVCCRRGSTSLRDMG